MYVVEHKDSSGHTTRYELTGKLKFLNHSCRPNAAISRFELRAGRPIAVGQEITISYGSAVCNCEQALGDTINDALSRSIAAVA
jgi:SET domain-containing protein